MIVFKSDRIWGPKGFVSGYVVAMEQYKITGITPVKPSWFSGEYYDFTDKIIVPGFIDVHTHGAGGHPFSGTADDMVQACDFHLAHGTTTVLPTVSTYSEETARRSARNVAEVMRSRRTKGRVAGIHLEGPYISKSRCGGSAGETPAGADAYVRLADEYGGVIRRWTFAPECDPDGEFCRFVTSRGIVASAGHTNGTAEQLKKSIGSGCRLVTHLYSCTSSVKVNGGRCAAGISEGALLYDVAVEAVADGRRLSPELLMLIYKTKGADGMILCTDSLPCTGTERAGETAFSGSAATADGALRFAVSCGIPLWDAVKMLTRTPADLMRIDAGRIEPGYPIDLAVLDEGLNVTDVFFGGKKVV